MGLQELEQSWAEYQPGVAKDYGDWDGRREETAPLYLEALDSFLSGGVDLHEFRKRVDLLSRANPFFGFNGTSQMFFNQLVNAGEGAAVEEALKAVLPVPADQDEALLKLEGFVAAVEAARDQADAIGVRRPDVARIDAFVTMFWEFADRDSWPALYPNSREVLATEGLLDQTLPQPQLYAAFRELMRELKSRLGTTTWNVEHLLWHLREEEKARIENSGTSDPQPGNGGAPPADLYEHYLLRRLYLTDEVVTSLVLSLATKPFVILSGLSGTGKTKIAQELARYLEARPGTTTTTEAPQPGPRDIFFKLTAARIQRGFGPVSPEARSVIESSLAFPDRGESLVYTVRIPDGSLQEIRITNYDFADKSRVLYRMIFRGELRKWVNETVKAGDVLHLKLEPEGEAEMELSMEAGVSLPSEPQRRRYAVIPVKSDWTDPRGLIGFFNPITRQYVTTELVDLLVRAGADRARPYLVILDEMNLARVEYYFSDFLSVLESGESLRLMTEAEATENASAEDEDEGAGELPDELEIPPNVSFIGTVNVDETTHPLSPKVLDRANVIEFNAVDLDRALGGEDDGASASGLRLAVGADIPSWLLGGDAESEQAMTLAHQQAAFTSAVRSVHGILSRWDLQFGYRVIEEMSVFVGHGLEKVAAEDAEEIVRESFDLQLNQKVIPKLSGGRELEEPLTALLYFAIHGEEKQSPVDIDTVLDEARKTLAGAEGAVQPRYPRAARKLFRMVRRLGATGFVGALE